MQTYKCCYQMCLDIPKWMCACSSPPCLLCQSHLGVHLVANASPSCSPQIIELQPVNAGSKIKFIQHIKSQQLYIEKTKKDLIIQASNINDLISKVLTKALRDLKGLETRCSLLLKKAINMNTNCSPYCEVGSILSKNPDEINSLLPSWNFSEFLNPINGIFANLEQYLNTNFALIDPQNAQIHNIAPSPLPQLLPKNPSSSNGTNPQEIPLPGSSLIFYHSTNKQIIEIDTITNTTRNDSIRLESYMSQGISMIRLPNRTIFCYGDTDDNRKGSTFIIESKSRITHLQNGWPCKWASLAYLNGNIYAFGGSEGLNKLNTFRRFDIVSKRWNQPGTMPIFMKHSSAVTFQGKVYVVDYDTGHLYSLDPDTGIFSQRIQAFKAAALKLLFSDMDNLYVIESGGSIYMGNPPNKLAKVHGPMPNLFADKLASPILVIDSFAYYVALQSQASEYFLYKFDMKRRVNSKENEWL
ncbi:unnamed protein product [Blepharisma stoltei]|uniref:Kelch motif family protein n=1 Tax=Blepharisma stoltei TaxID=1481888 RepID=A0AAU9JVD4_9CILI|nr:unnamed protein product [Blepharisma stoltei]